jgi:solute carrier family 25 (mitochondrial folate transporter), member 32
MLTALFTNPIWVIKTRMLSTGSNVPGAYPSLMSGVRQILKSEGVAGFYRGLVPSLLGVTHAAFQFMAYEQLKVYWSSSKMPGIRTTRQDGNAGRALGNLDLLAISTLSKVFAGVITYPYQVLRTRLQIYDAVREYPGVTDAVIQIWRKEGLNGFYKGLAPNILKVLPGTWVTFLVYENMRTYLPRIAAGDV